VTALTQTALYVYAIVPPGGGLPRGGEAILPGASVEIIAGEDGGIAALVSLVPRGLFAPDDPASRAAEPEWVAARAAAHHDVVALAHAAGPCLPLGFGTLFASSHGVRHWLAGQAPVFVPALSRVAARQEWAVTLTTDRAAHAAWARAHDAAAQQLAASLATAGPGAAFLLTRRLEKAVQQACAAQLAQAASRTEHYLAGCGAVLPDPPGHGAAASWSVLASTGMDVPARLAGLEARLGGAGLGLRATGPWPAYAFARAAWQGGRNG
jgi:hypothetical protein